MNENNFIVLNMLQSTYYDVENSNEQQITDPNTVTTPFSVKDILNIVEGSEGYTGYHIDRYTYAYLFKVLL